MVSDTIRGVTVDEIFVDDMWSAPIDVPFVDSTFDYEALVDSLNRHAESLGFTVEGVRFFSDTEVELEASYLDQIDALTEENQRLRRQLAAYKAVSTRRKNKNG